MTGVRPTGEMRAVWVFHVRKRRSDAIFSSFPFGQLTEKGRQMKFTETLKKNYEFQRLYHKGKSAVTPYLVVYARRSKRAKNRIGFTVSAKLGCAVQRNRVRRRLREIYRLHEAELRMGTELVVVARARAVHSDYHQMERAFLSACAKLGLLREAPQ